MVGAIKRLVACAGGEANDPAVVRAGVAVGGAVDGEGPGEVTVFGLEIGGFAPGAAGARRSERVRW